MHQMPPNRHPENDPPETPAIQNDKKRKNWRKGDCWRHPKRHTEMPQARGEKRGEATQQSNPKADDAIETRLKMPANNNANTRAPQAPAGLIQKTLQHPQNSKTKKTKGGARHNQMESKPPKCRAAQQTTATMPPKGWEKPTTS